MNYEDMSDEQINDRVAYFVPYLSQTDYDYVWNELNSTEWDGCNNPNDALPIVFENNISLHHHWKEKGKYTAIGIKITERSLGPYHESIEVTLEKGKELRAAMIVFLTMKDTEK